MNSEVLWERTNEKNSAILKNESRIVYLTHKAYSQFPYPVRKKRMLDVLTYIRVYQENIIAARIRHYGSSKFYSNPYIKEFYIGDIEFDYFPVRNNSHLYKIPLKDKLFEKYQGIHFKFKFQVHFLFYRSLNYVKLKDREFYDELCSKDFMNGMFSNVIFRSIMDSNIDDLF